MTRMRRLGWACLLSLGSAGPTSCGGAAGDELSIEQLRLPLTGDGGIRAELEYYSPWYNGYCTHVRVSNDNPEATAHTWSVTLNLGEAVFSTTWNGTFARNGQTVVVTPAPYNATIGPQQNTMFGFCATLPSPFQPVITEVSSDLPPLNCQGELVDGVCIPPSPTSCQPGVPCALMVVDSALHGQLEAQITQYAADVQAARGVHVRVDADLAFAGLTPAGLRSRLRHAGAIDTAILVGRAPYARWEQDWDFYNEGVNSFYYEDLDGSFSDTDGDGLHDLHDWGANPGPEIAVSWLFPSSAGAISELESFFAKAHAYYSGTLSYRQRGLVMIHSDWAHDMHSAQNYYGQLEGLFGADIDARGGFDASGAPIPVNGDDYLALLAGGYAATVIYTHANWDAHYPNENPITTSEIMATPAGSLITFIGGCHSGDVHASAGAPTIATSYVFGTPLGLASTGTTWSYGPEELAVVNSGLVAGDTLGDAWFAKQALRNTPSFYLRRYSGAPNFDPNRHMFGEILFGDPFVTVD